MPNDTGKLRRSAAISNFGPGAIVDFRAGGAAVSGVAAGLEEWDFSFPPAGLRNPQRTQEPRLQRKLGVKGFRLPPVVNDDNKDANGNLETGRLVAVRFPQWLQCRRCDRIAPENIWGDDPGRAYRFCVACTSKAPGQNKIFVIPVRFVMACEGGHLDEFPWHQWVAHKADCQNTNGYLALRAERAGLAGLIVSCSKCGSRRSLDGIFGEETWKGQRCSGRRPWLHGRNEQCGRRPRALQRGASNLYFPVTESALDIPPWSDRLQAALGTYWSDIVSTDPQDRPAYIGILARNTLKDALTELRLKPEQLADEIERRLRIIENPKPLEIRQEEYRQFTLGGDTAKDESEEFEIRKEIIPQNLAPFLSRVVRAVRLREVRALRGFTRINPPEDSNGQNINPLSNARLDWLPAIQVRGEGIFLEMSAARLKGWEDLPLVKGRAAAVDAAWQEESQRRYRQPSTRRISARFLLIHTFSHALMRQLTLECGYSSAALRERLYVSAGDQGMAGLLVYTSTSDADGTLGGLQRQGESRRLERTLPGAIQAMEWCSSDPLCIEGMMTRSEACSQAACHGCVLAPETACEEFNRLLDRALLVGLPGTPEVGFFEPLLRSRTV